MSRGTSAFRNFQTAYATFFEARVRCPYARERSRHPHNSIVARPQQHFHNSELSSAGDDSSMFSDEPTRPPAPFHTTPSTSCSNKRADNLRRASGRRIARISSVWPRVSLRPISTISRNAGCGNSEAGRTEFRSFLNCGILARGFLRLRCQSCGHDRLLAFSCKGRVWCPSCGGRRMADTAAYLVDRVLPVVPVRQWVLSLPFALRYRILRAEKLRWMQRVYDLPVPHVALRTGILERVACQTCALVQHCRESMPAVLKKGQGLMATRRFIMTSDTAFRLMTGGACRAIQSRRLSMHVVAPSCCV
jgi:hypothetical protein